MVGRHDFRDLNSRTAYASSSLRGGTRGVADDFGLLCLRARLDADDIKGESLNSHHNWVDTVARYEWIDDILTTKTVKLQRAALWRTSADVATATYGGTPSDHNLLRIEAIL